nr:MAG TPA: chaperone protein [Caudoviricetes sp.]
MEKKRKYCQETIEVCRNCKGCGVVQPTPEFHPHGKEIILPSVPCPVCAGSGRIKRRSHIEITITPYSDNPPE